MPSTGAIFALRSSNTSSKLLKDKSGALQSIIGMRAVCSCLTCLGYVETTKYFIAVAGSLRFDPITIASRRNLDLSIMFVQERDAFRPLDRLSLKGLPSDLESLRHCKTETTAVDFYGIVVPNVRNVLNVRGKNAF